MDENNNQLVKVASNTEANNQNLLDMTPLIESKEYAKGRNNRYCNPSDWFIFYGLLKPVSHRVQNYLHGCIILVGITYGRQYGDLSSLPQYLRRRCVGNQTCS